MLKAVIFDLDDTLIDWSKFSGDWAEMESRHLSGVFDYVCELHALTDREQYYTEVRNRTMTAWTDARSTNIAPNLGAVLIESAEALGVPPGRLDMRRCLEAYRWDAVQGTEIFPEVVDVLTQLRDAGLKLGIITNAYQPMWLRDIELKTYGLLHFFPDCRFSAADVGLLKPRVEIFQGALECLGVQPSEAVFVGDDPDADVVGAQAAGIKAVWRETRRRPILLDGLVPDGRLRSLEELPTLLDAWYPGWR